MSQHEMALLAGDGARLHLSDDGLRGLSVKQLRALIAKCGMTTLGCIDKADLIDRAAEAQRKQAAGGAANGAPDAEAIANEIAALPSAELLPALESVLRATPSQESALRAHECLERLTKWLMEDVDGEESTETAAGMSSGIAESAASLPRGRLLAAILGGMKMGLGGQGGLFCCACMPLPYALQQYACEGEGAGEDAGALISAAEEEYGVGFFETLVGGLAKFDAREELQAAT
jgi:hypothetical protein